MTKPALVKALSRWIESTLGSGAEHCFDLRPRFRIPGAGPVDLLTVRHTLPALPGQPHAFSVGLWTIREADVDERAADAMTRRVLAFEAWYSEFLEHAEIQGFSPSHRISVCGNLVGRAIRRSPLIDLLSNWGSALYFWTWRRKAAALDVSPYYGKGPALAAPRAHLKALLPHLPWQDTADRDLEASRAAHRS